MILHLKFSHYLILFWYADLYWLEKNIQSMISEEKFCTESNVIVRKIQKIYWKSVLNTYFTSPTTQCSGPRWEWNEKSPVSSRNSRNEKNPSLASYRLGLVSTRLDSSRIFLVSNWKIQQKIASFPRGSLGIV